MAQKANPGELRTPVFFMQAERVVDDSGYPEEKEVNVFGDDVYVLVKWAPEFGTEVFTNFQLEIKEPVVMTMRYSPKINPRLLVYKKGDTDPFEIISLNNINDRNAWLEVNLRRKVPAR